MDTIFTVQMRCNYKELWRYNIVVVAACFDEEHNCVDMASERRDFAEVGSNLKAAPEGFKFPCEVVLTTPACHSIEAIVYLIPNTLPSARQISQSEPFGMDITVRKGDEEIYSKNHKINQWAGTATWLKF